MSKAQPLKDMGKFFEGMVRDTVGNLTGFTQFDRAGRENLAAKDRERRTARYETFDPTDIERFAAIGGELTGKTRAELEAARPKSFMASEYLGMSKSDRLRKREDVEASYAGKTEEERSRIQGLYKAGQARLGAIERGRLRPGRKQTVLTKRM